jgi:hypothetical protein
MKIIYKTLLIAIVVLSISCNKRIKQNEESFNGSELNRLIELTLHSDKSSSDKLHGLFTFVSQDFTTYNKLLIDSILIDKKIFYSVLIENQNPIYNLFAIIDSKMDLLLKDESLNGYLNSSWKKSGSRILAVVDENFKSKDLITLNRISFYSLDSLACDLVFRQFTKIKTPDKEAFQNISFISDTTIKTEILGSNSSLKPDKDIFRFDVSKNQYVSNKNKFGTFVMTEINQSNIPTNGFQIADVESIRRLLGLNQDTLNIDNLSLISDNDFVIKLDNQWKKLGNYVITDGLKKEMKGFKFINTRIGAGISVFKIAYKDSAENYFDKALIKQNQGNSNQRTSEIFEDEKDIYKLYEFSCPSKKLILILEAPKSTYQNYLDVYSNIFKSFKIKC